MLWQKLALLIGALYLAPAVQADDLTDALVGVDPRTKLQSGAGAALDNVYRSPGGSGGGSTGLWTPGASQPSAPVRPDTSYRGLPSQGSSMDVHEEEKADEEPQDYRYPALGPWYGEDEPAGASGSTDSTSRSDTIPLGKPDARPGVYYFDDASH